MDCVPCRPLITTRSNLGTFFNRKFVFFSNPRMHFFQFEVCILDRHTKHFSTGGKWRVTAKATFLILVVQKACARTGLLWLNSHLTGCQFVWLSLVKQDLIHMTTWNRGCGYKPPPPPPAPAQVRLLVYDCLLCPQQTDTTQLHGSCYVKLLMFDLQVHH